MLGASITKVKDVLFFFPHQFTSCKDHLLDTFYDKQAFQTKYSYVVEKPFDNYSNQRILPYCKGFTNYDRDGEFSIVLWFHYFLKLFISSLKN